MSNAGLEIDMQYMIHKLDSLNDKEMKKVRRRALVTSMGVLKRRTDQLYSTQTNLSRRKTKLPKRSKPGKSKVTYDWKKGSAKVHILSDFMMGWFEIGVGKKASKDRYTKGRKKSSTPSRYKINPKKGGRRTGVIMPMLLFKKAQEDSERKILEDLDGRISKAIEYVWKRKK